MEIRNKKITIPFYCVGWYRQDVLVHTYYDVKFYEDFGSFVRNEKFSSIDVDYDKGIIEAFNKEGTEVIKRVEYKAIPIN